MDKDWESINNMVIAYCDVNFVPIIQSLVKKADNEESKTEEKSEFQKSEQSEQISVIQKESNFTFSQQQLMQELGGQKRQSEVQLDQNTSLNISGEGNKTGLEESRGNIQQSPAILTPSNVTLEDLQIESAKGKQATGITTRKTLAKHNAVAFLGQQMYVLPKGKQCYIIPGFCYLVFETFINESNFDMKQVKQEEEEKTNKKPRPVSKEKKKKNNNFEQSPLTKASSIRKKSPNQRESQLSVSRGSGGTRMKSKQKKHRKKHEEKKEFTVYQLIKLINKIENVPLLNIPCPWSHSEVQEAQKRHLNREFYHKMEERKKAALRRLEYSDEDSDLDKSQELNPEEIEAEMQKLKEPLKRIPGGYWMQFSDFPNVFQHFYILYNPVQYKFSLFIDNLWEPNINSFEFKPEYEVILIEPLQEQKEEENQLISPRALKSSQSPQPVIELLILFMPQLLDNFVIDTKSVRFKLQEFNVLDDSLIQEICNIQSTSISGQIIKLPKQNFILRPFTVGCPYGYSALIVSKNCKLSSMSKFQYLEDKLNWTTRKISLEHGDITGYCLLFRINIIVEQECDIFLNLKIPPALHPFCNLMLVPVEGYELNYKYLSLSSLSKFKQKLKQGTHRLILQAFLQNPQKEGLFDLEFSSLSETNPLIENQETLDPVFYNGIYKHNKFGIIFKMHLFTLENTNATFYLTLKQPVKMQSVVVFQIYNQDEVILETKGYNSSQVMHIKFQNISTAKYRITAKYDLFQSKDQDGATWELKVISNETIAFILDTDKEDQENSIRKKWEEAQPGRAEFSKRTRDRYLASKKQASELNEEERVMISESFDARRKVYKDFVTNTQPKEEEKKQKKEEKKVAGKKDQQKQVEEIEEKFHNISMDLPVLENHNNENITQYIQHLQGNRLLMYLPGTNPKLRTEEERSQQREGVHLQYEDCCSKLREKNQKRISEQQAKQKQKEGGKSQRLNQEEWIQKQEIYKKTRDGYRKKMFQRSEKAEALKELLNQEEIDISNLEESIQQAIQHNCLPQTIQSGQNKLFQLKSQEVSSNLQQALEDQNAEELENWLQKVQNLKVSQKLVAQCQSLLQELKNAK